MLLLEKKIGTLPVYVFEKRDEMGVAAAKEAADQINALIKKKGDANIMFAAAPSQLDMIKALMDEKIDWSCVRAFHQDEYIGLDLASPAGFGNFLRRNIYDALPFKALYFLECSPDKIEEKCKEYSELMDRFPPDIIFLGFGENGHLAFNDPPVADFDDPLRLKVVQLDATCRNQQVNDGCFDSLSDVPTYALTITMSQILAIPSAIAVVPSTFKANAVDAALNGDISTKCPASSLRNHPNATLYLDKGSAQKAFKL